MILVNEGTRGFVLSRVTVGEPCPHCASEERDVGAVPGVRLLPGLLRELGSPLRRRMPAVPSRARAAGDRGLRRGARNSILYGHRFGLAALLSLVAISVAILAIGVRNRAVTIVLLAV